MLRAILIEPLLNVLLLFYGLVPGRDFGLAVILLTVLIRLLLWPLLRRQLHHTKTMRDLQPEMAKIRAKAKGDRQKESAMMLELFKEKQINPFGSLGLAFLQFPILIALFFVLQKITTPEQIEALTYGFVASLEAVGQIIAQPSSFDPTFLGLVHMAKPNLILALAAGGTQFVQARQITPQKPDRSNPQASLGFTMNLMFPILTIVIAAQLPSALALYWATSSLIAIFQQQLVLSEDVSLMRKLTFRGQRHDTRQ